MMKSIFLILTIVSLVAVFSFIFLLISRAATHKPKNGIGTLIVFSVVCTIIFGLLLVAFSSDVKEAEPIVESEEVIDETVSFAEIYTAFEDNKLSAEETYNGNRYVITAKVNGMETDGLINMTGGATLTMEATVDNVTVFFLAEFEKDQEEALKQISVGDTITFTGICNDGTFSSCELEN